MVGVEYTFLIGGYMLSCWVDYGFNFLLPKDTSWQGPYFVQMGLAFILFSMSFFLPETPRWLARNGFKKEALQTVADLHSAGNIEDEGVHEGRPIDDGRTRAIAAPEQTCRGYCVTAVRMDFVGAFTALC